MDEHIKASFDGDYDQFEIHLGQRLEEEFKRDYASWTRCNFRSSSTDNCFIQWASESAKALCDYVYFDDNGNKIQNGFELGTSYFNSNAEKAEDLYIKAAVRLAFILNSAVDSDYKGFSSAF